MNIPKVCERCGAEIRLGRFCSRCITILSYEKTFPQEIKDFLREKELRERKMARVYRKSYREKHPKKVKNQMKKWYHTLRLEILSHYSGVPPFCACCGEDTIQFLCIDHIKGGGIQHRRIVGYGSRFYKWLKDNNFPEGYRVLCYNCNNATSHGRICPHQKLRILPKKLRG